MELEKHLVLNKYFLNLFDIEEFNELREKLKDIKEGYDTTGRSYFIDVLIGLKPEWEDLFLKYDEAIREYVEKLRQNRRQPNFDLKYFQYLAVFFTEIFLDKYYNDRQRFLNDLNAFLGEFNGENTIKIFPFTDKDLKKLAFWMATGSGKTLLMHINYWQILKHSKNDWDNIILITPNEGLSKQHYDELNLSGIPCKLYDGNIGNLKTRDKEILIIDIHKLTEEKKGEGVSIDISYFDGKNLVFIDEGHKGQKSEEQKWKKLREEIGKNGFLFEYSATFGQVIGKNKDLLEEYAKAIIFDYSYKYFYTDGYGKDFYVYNIQAQKEGKKDIYSEEQQRLLLTAGLLSFYEQLEIFGESKEEFREYNIEKPLWIFVGSKVTGKGINSDVVRVIQFLDKIIKDDNYLKETIKRILQGKSGLIDSNGNDIFDGKFEYIRKKSVEEVVGSIYQKVFNGKGILEIYEIKNADGELGLKTSTGEKYFGVINVGDVSSLKKLISESDIDVKEDHFNQSLFFGINDSNSPINILIGSKKFVEGWNSWRVSNMGLINMGKSEGPQIIQLFGRGVRLKGKNYSLKREENPDYRLKTLQTLFIFGLNADYINAFLETIEKEEVDYNEIEIPIKFNNPENWEDKIHTIKTKEDFDFLNSIIRLSFEENILNSIKIDLRPKITVAHGLKVGTADTTIDEPLRIPDEYFDFIDWDFIYSEIINYKITNQFYNLILDIETIKKIIRERNYKLFISESEDLKIEEDNKISIRSFEGFRKFQDIILMVLKSYISKFYKIKYKQESMKYLEAEKLSIDNHLHMYPEDKKVIVKVPQDLEEDIKKIKKQLEDYKPEENKIPKEWENGSYFIFHFGNHLYTPLIVWMKNKDKIKSFPVRLNKGETKFVMDLKNYLKKYKKEFENKEIFLLRNLSRKGIGFFINAGFYPDFILWIKDKDQERMIFIDPKGIRNLGNFSDDKIQFCYRTIKEIEKKINEKNEELNLKLNAFIISVTPYEDIRDIFREDQPSKEEFENHKIIFQEDSEYIDKIFSL